MDHSTHTPLDPAELNASNLLDAVVYGAEDYEIGTVSEVHGSGSSIEVIVDVGGFLGIGAKPVVLGASELTFMRDADGDVHATTAWTKDQIKDLPEHRH